MTNTQQVPETVVQIEHTLSLKNAISQGSSVESSGGAPPPPSEVGIEGWEVNARLNQRRIRGQGYALAQQKGDKMKAKKEKRGRER